MKEDARRDGSDGPEREELRAALRHWSVPAAPAEIEDGLRQEFRRRRRQRRVGMWLGLAASIGLLAAWPLIAPGPAAPPAASQKPVATAGASSVAAPRLEPPAPPAARSPGREGARRSAPSPRAAEPTVIVEPAQAELLAELGRKAWETPEAAPGATIPAHRAEWERVAGEWPAVQVAVPNSER